MNSIGHIDYTVVLRDTRNGFTKAIAGVWSITHDPRRYDRDELISEVIGLCEWNWEDGNDGCDCNRSRMLYEDEAQELPCGDGTIELVSLKFGDVHWKDSIGPQSTSPHTVGSVQWLLAL